MFERQIADAVSRRMPPHHLRRILDLEPRDLCSILRSSGLQWNGERYSRIETERDDEDDGGVPGLRPGDRWCLCALRWKEAFEASKAPKVILEATHEAALRYVTLDDLLRHAAVRAEA